MVVGCVSTAPIEKVPFLYDPPQMTGYPSGYVLAVREIEDKRKDAKNVDSIYKSDPMEEMLQIINHEVMSTKMFSKIVRVPLETKNEFTYSKEKSARFLMYPTLLEMGWTLPGEEEQEIDASIYGDMKLNIKIVDSSSGKVLLDKEYTGWCENKARKEICELPMIKASMIGRSFKIIMTKLKTDLTEMVNSRAWKQAP